MNTWQDAEFQFIQISGTKHALKIGKVGRLDCYLFERKPSDKIHSTLIKMNEQNIEYTQHFVL
jgi:hypothetical protein